MNELNYSGAVIGPCDGPQEVEEGGWGGMAGAGSGPRYLEGSHQHPTPTPAPS